jgi:glycine cleavage system aminomethyltransferase T
MILDETGGIIDDLMVWRWPEAIWVMPNGVNHQRVLDEIIRAGEDVDAEDLRPTTAAIAVQGPDAPRLLHALLEVDVRRGHLAESGYADVPVWVVAERDAVERALVAFTTDTRQIPRPHNRLRADGSTGWVTSGNFSPALGSGIGMGYLEPPTNAPIEVEIRQTWHTLRRVTPPFNR